jgi:hypothetical protein
VPTFFLWANAAVLGSILIVWMSQEIFVVYLGQAVAPPMIVTERVMLMLIAASAAQLGSLAVGIGLALFKGPPRDRG